MAMALSIAAILLFVWAAATDMVARVIPNRIVVLLAALGVLRLGIEIGSGQAPLRALADIGLCLGVLLGGAALFRAGVFGGGDAKLLAAGALWLGAGSIGAFMLATVLAGAALAGGFVLWLMVAGPRAARPSLPYGVAIAVGGVLGTLSAL